MISAVQIHKLRGIEAATLTDLAPLTVLTGFNGSGKSTVLDALLLGASPRPADAVGRAIQRHPDTVDGARWLLDERETRLLVTVDGQMIERRFVRRDGELDRSLEDKARGTGLRTPMTTVEARGPHDLLGVTAIDPDHAFVHLHLHDDLRSRGAVRLVDPGVPHHIDSSYGALARQPGGKQRLLVSLRELAPSVEDVELLPESERRNSLHLRMGGALIPSTLAGDGVHAFLQTAVELATLSGGTMLLEEPEVYQHPVALMASARGILAAVRRGVQVVLTTHSEELIRMLLTGLRDEGGLEAAFFLLALREGRLIAVRRSGEEAAERSLDVGMGLR